MLMLLNKSQDYLSTAIMSIAQMEEHFVIVVQADNVAKLRFHLA
jgi:hypothetical protein